MLSIKCKTCGATNAFEENDIPSFCSFCGAALPDMAPYVKEAIKISQERERHKMEIEKLDKKMKREKSRRISDIFEMIPLILLLALGFFFFYWMFTVVR